MEYKKGIKVFGQWEITEELGQGTNGKVFVVEKNEYGVSTKSALKVLTIPSSVSEIRSALSSGMDELSVTSYFKSRVESIMHECAVMSTLKSCENIVHFEDYTVIEHNADIGAAFRNNEDNLGWDILIRMELLTDLDTFQLDHTLTESDVIKMTKDILNALVFCKKKGVVHRDIKPANILVSDTGVYKLGDFGESRTMDRTFGATRRGTEIYMAPEVYLNRPYGSSVDIYSLGLVMYKLMNKNRLPFYPPAGQMISFTDTETALKRRVEGEVPPPPADASEGFSAIILKAISPSSDERYHDAEDVLYDLSQLCGGLENNNVVSCIAEGYADSEFNDTSDCEKTIGFFGQLPVETDKYENEFDKTLGVFGEVLNTNEEDAYGRNQTLGVYNQFIQEQSNITAEPKNTRSTAEAKRFWKENLKKVLTRKNQEVAFAPLPYLVYLDISRMLKRNIQETPSFQEVIGIAYTKGMSSFSPALLVTYDSLYISVSGCCAKISLNNIELAKVYKWRENINKISVVYRDGKSKTYGLLNKNSLTKADSFDGNALAELLNAF